MAHKLKKIRSSGYLYKGKFIEIEVWGCEKCKKVMILNSDTEKRITLNGELGEEIKDSNCD
ncbi:MAG: hypothetical protein WC516_06145 [Patescibacteria group bacterium]|jgi:hypothetical protein